MAVNRYYAVNLGQPTVQITRQLDQVFRVIRDRLANRLEQADPYWELDKHRPQASQRVHAVFLVHLHRLLRDALTVVLVLFLDLLHQRLKSVHRFHLPGALDGQWDHHQPHQHRESNNRYAEITEKHPVQQQQAVDHGLYYYRAPGVA